jgi:hypothetical protein
VLLTARSPDGGLHFGDSQLVSGTNTVGNRGWQAMAVSPTGSVHLAWLDHRRMAAEADAAVSHQHHGASATTAESPAVEDPVDTSIAARKSDLYFAALAGAPEPRAVTAGVCYCCKTAMAHGPDGAIHLTWRHVYPGNMRDIAFTVSRDDGATFSEPVRVSEDQWAIAGCPDDGPSMAVDTAGRLHIVWPTAVAGTDGTARKSLFHSMTVDGRTFSPRVAIPHDGDASHPQIVAIGDGSVVVAWDGYVGDTAHVHRARGTFDSTGALRFVPGSAAPVPGRYPTLVVAEKRLLTAWSDRQGSASSIRLSIDSLD